MRKGIEEYAIFYVDFDMEEYKRYLKYLGEDREEALISDMNLEFVSVVRDMSEDVTDFIYQNTIVLNDLGQYAIVKSVEDKPKHGKLIHTSESKTYKTKDLDAFFVKNFLDGSLQKVIIK